METKRAGPALHHRLGQLRRAGRRRPCRGALAGGRCGAMVGQGRWHSARAGVRRGAAARQYRQRRASLFLHRCRSENGFQKHSAGDVADRLGQALGQGGEHDPRLGTGHRRHRWPAVRGAGGADRVEHYRCECGRREYRRSAGAFGQARALRPSSVGSSRRWRCVAVH